MPYKDPERKKEWERLHRPERLARRRELRRIEAARAETPCHVPNVEAGGSDLLIPETASDVSASNNPGLSMAVGGLTLVSSPAFKKAWVWWLVGCVILAVALLFYWRERQISRKKSAKAK